MMEPAEAAKMRLKVRRFAMRSGVFDGMGTDECGNLYIANNNGPGEIIRFTPDGTNYTVVVNNVTNTVTIMNPNGQTQTCRLRSRWRLRPARRRRI